MAVISRSSSFSIDEGTISVTEKEPFVRVPVLSNTTVEAFERASR